MSDETTQSSTGTEAPAAQPVLGSPASTNGATGTQTAVVEPVLKAEAKKDDDVAAPPPADDVAAKKLADDAAAKTAADAKALEAKTAAEKTAAAEKAWAEFKPQRGEGIKTDEATLKEAIAGFREAGLTPEQAQKVIGLNDKFIATQAKAQAAEAERYFTEQRAAFLKASNADKDYGGKIDAATKVASKAFEKYLGADGLQALLKDFPNLDAHPVIFKAFHRIGVAMKDDSISGTASTATAKPNEQAVLDAIFPSMKRS